MNKRGSGRDFGEQIRVNSTEEQPFSQDRRGDITGLPDGPITAITSDSHGRVFASALNELFIGKAAEYSIHFQPIPEVTSPVTQMVFQNQGRNAGIWVWTEDSSMYFFRDGEESYSPTRTLPPLSQRSPGSVDEEAETSADALIDANLKEMLGPSSENLPFPDAEWNDIATDAHGHHWIITNHGVAVWNESGYWISLTSEDGLPLPDVLCISSTKDGTRWFGLSRGIARFRNGEWRYFAGKRWLPNDTVTAMESDGAGGVFVATPEGLGWIAAEPMTLEDKAGRFLALTRERHCRHGYVSNSILQQPGVLSSFLHEASDNDGLWTALYVAAECFRYMVTQDLDAKVMANESMLALERLEAVTPIPGFPARAMVFKDDVVHRSDYGTGGEWHPLADGSGEWKGDTSSDELDGHFFACAVFYETMDEPQWKERVAAYAARIADHLIENDFNLIDLDGKHTRWGFFSPKILNTDVGIKQRGLNSLEILSYLKTAHTLTGEARFQEAYLHLIHDHHYALNLVKQKIITPGHVNHSDDELAFLAYYSLLRHETDPNLLALYRWSLRRSWEIERPEKSPFFNVIYGALIGLPCDRDVSRRALEEIPMDLIHWRVENSHRGDVTLDEEAGRFREPQSKIALSLAERPMMKWNGNPYRLDGGSDGGEEEDGAFFLLPYWMGRAYGVL